MPLDKVTLAKTLKQLFKDAKDNNWESDQVAGELTDAIDQFVRSGDVVQVTVDVRDSSNVLIGTGTQTGTGKVQ